MSDMSLSLPTTLPARDARTALPVFAPRRFAEKLRSSRHVAEWRERNSISLRADDFHPSDQVRDALEADAFNSVISTRLAPCSFDLQLGDAIEAMLTELFAAHGAALFDRKAGGVEQANPRVLEAQAVLAESDCLARTISVHEPTFVLVREHEVELECLAGIRELGDKVGAKVIVEISNPFQAVSLWNATDLLRRGAHGITFSPRAALLSPISHLMLTDDADLMFETDGARSAIAALHTAPGATALALELAETLEFGRERAAVTIEAATKLATRLEAEGFAVLCAGVHQRQTDKIFCAVDWPSPYVLERCAAAHLPVAAVPHGDGCLMMLSAQGLARRDIVGEKLDTVARWLRRILIDNDYVDIIGSEVISWAKSHPPRRFSFADQRSLASASKPTGIL